MSFEVLARPRELPARRKRRTANFLQPELDCKGGNRKCEIQQESRLGNRSSAEYETQDKKREIDAQRDQMCSFQNGRVPPGLLFGGFLGDLSADEEVPGTQIQLIHLRHDTIERKANVTSSFYLFV